MFGENLPFLNVLFLLVAFHYLCDYALQNDYIAKAKNHTTDLGKDDGIWVNVLLAHGFIHALGVYIVTLSLSLSVLQLIVHVVTDFYKCDGKISHWLDQQIHLVTMLLIASLYTFYG